VVASPAWQNSVSNVLIIRPGALGDTLMLLPALMALDKDVKVTVAAREPGLTFLKQAGTKGVDMEGAGWYRLFREKPDLRQQLPVPPQDVIAAYLADTDGRIGRNLRAYFPGAAIHILAAYPAVKEKMHVARYVCETLAGAGLPVDPARAMERAGNGVFWKRGGNTLPEKRIVVHPGSGSSGKNLPPEFWRAFLHRIAQEPALEDHKKVVLLGPAEEGMRDFFGKWASQSGEMVICPRHAELVSLLGRAGLYAGHDSGITHLAAMLGTPTVAVFRENTLSLWHPLGPYTRAIRSRKADGTCLERLLEAARSLLVRASSPDTARRSPRSIEGAIEDNS
jgi:ADP-heptose:LPS heptosyltransferase